MENNEINKQREVFTQAIRKQNREEKFSKKRNLNTTIVPENSTETMLDQKKEKKPVIVDEQRRQLLEKYIGAAYDISMFQQLKQNVLGQDINLKHRGVIGIRKIISVDNEPPIQTVIDSLLVPYFIDLMKQTFYPQLQLESTWILTNVCSGTTHQCQSVIDKGGIPLFIKLLIQNRVGIVDQAVWAVGNLSGDCVKYRDLLLKAGAMEPLVKISNSTKDKNLIRHTAWAISNLCRGNPLPKYQVIKNGVVVLCHILKAKVLDNQGLIDALWSISYACQSQKSKIQRVMQTGVVQCLIGYCQTQYLNILTPALRILGNVSTGNQLQTQQLLKNGILTLFLKLIDHDKKAIRRQVCWIISNIAAGTKSQVERILQNTVLIKKILNLFEKDANDVKRQTCYVFSNMVNLGQPQKVMQLYLSQNIMEYYARILIIQQDVKTLEVTLDTLYTALNLGDKVKQSQSAANVLVNQLMNIPGLIQSFQKLQYHQSKSVYLKTVKILKKHFELQQDIGI